MAPVVQDVRMGAVAVGLSLPIPVPSGVQVGELLLATIYTRSATVAPVANGWTVITTTTGGGGAMYRLGKIADPSDVAASSAGSQSYTFTAPSGTNTTIIGAIRRVTGVDLSAFPGTPGSIFSSTAGTAISTGATATTTNSATGAGAADGDLVLRDIAVFSGGWAGTPATVGAWSDAALEAVKTTLGQSSAALLLAREALSGASSAPSRAATWTKNAVAATPQGYIERTVTLKAAPSTIAPVNTVVPSITIPGTHTPPRQGEDMVGHIGTWTGTPAPTFAVEFRRDGVQLASTAVTGVTDPAQTFTRVATANDVGHDITFHVTATNSAGSVSADSTPPVVPDAQPALTASDLPWLGSGSNNRGGAPAAAIVDNTFGNVFDNVVTTEAASGALVEHRVVYVRNLHPTATASGIKAYVPTNTPDPQTSLEIAYDDDYGKNVQYPELAAETTVPPHSLTFAAPTSEEDGTAVSLPDLGPGEYVHLVLRRSVSQGAGAFADDFADIAIFCVAA